MPPPYILNCILNRVLDPSTSVVDRLWGVFDGDAVIAKQRKR